MVGTLAPSLLSLNTATLTDAALAYAHRGIAVFPLIPGAKEPLVSGGFYSATTDGQMIAYWWSQWPQANIGIATGEPDGWVVLDVDPRHGGLTSLEAMERQVMEKGAGTPVRATLWQLTGGGGLHLIFHLPDLGIPPRRKMPAYPGIDLIERGYILAPPSVHPNGCVYTWQDARPPASFSSVLLELVFGHRLRARAQAREDPVILPARWQEAGPAEMDTERERDPEYWLHCALKWGTAPGGRHRYALFFAIKLIKAVGCSLAEAETWMRTYVARVTHLPHDPYALEDALECLAFAWQERNNPAFS